MIQYAEIQIFDHFLESDLLDPLDIAFCDSTNCSPTFNKFIRSQGMIQKPQMHI